MPLSVGQSFCYISVVILELVFFDLALIRYMHRSGIDYVIEINTVGYWLSDSY